MLPFVFDVEGDRIDSQVIAASPLVYLMIDQVQTLRRRGVQPALMFTAGACGTECLSLLANEEDISKSKFLRCTIEVLVHGRWIDVL